MSALVANNIRNRLLQVIPTLLIVSLLTFSISRLAPGSPFNSEKALSLEQEQVLKERYCLDRPILAQYFQCYLPDLILRQDLGPSFKYRNRSVNELIADALPSTVALGVAALIWALLIGIVAGVIGAVRQNTAWDYTAMSAAMLGISIPGFVLGPLLVLVFALGAYILPAGGWGTWRHLVLPALALGTIRAAYIARLTRGGMLEVVRADFIRTAHAKGLSERLIIWRHMLRGGLTPVVSYLGPAVSSLLVGSVVIEKIFATPGMGPYFVDAAINRDHNVTSGIVLIYSVVLISMNFLVDLSYRWLDPRVKDAT